MEDSSADLRVKTVRVTNHVAHMVIPRMKNARPVCCNPVALGLVLVGWMNNVRWVSLATTAAGEEQSRARLQAWQITHAEV